MRVTKKEVKEGETFFSTSLHSIKESEDIESNKAKRQVMEG